MLSLDTELITDILNKARQFQVKEEVSFPEITDDMDSFYVLEDHQDDAVYQEAIAIINDLRSDQQATLVALMWLGREDYSDYSWEETLNLALEEQTDHTGEYLLSTPLVADYIEEGLNKLGITYQT